MLNPKRDYNFVAFDMERRVYESGLSLAHTGESERQFWV